VPPTTPGQPAPPAPPAQPAATATPGQTPTPTPTPTPPPLAIAPTALYNPQNYQEFALVNDGVIFFFSQGQLLPEAAGATQVLVPRSAIDPMIA
jgi:Protein of unknown function (DUF3298)